jgi:hypothetical protein
MPNDYDQVVQELRDAGVDEQYVEHVNNLIGTSPLRKDLVATKAAHAEAQAVITRYRDKLLDTQLERLGVKAKAEALRIPDDLDPLDGTKVAEWAVAAGLAEAPPSPNAPNEELEAHTRVDAAGRGAGQPPSSDLMERFNNAQSEAEVMALAREAGIPIAGSL